MGWTWFKTKSAPPVPSDGLDRYKRNALYGRFSDGYNVFGPYRRPIEDATGGGTLNLRQLAAYSPNFVVPQQYTPVAITGSGSELTGAFTSIGLVDVTSNSNSNGVV